MIYRKAPPQPMRLLLRVVATAGVGAVAGAVACSSSSPEAVGVIPADGGQDSGYVMGATDGGDEQVFNGFVDGGGGIMGATDGQVSDVLNGVAPYPEGGPCEDGGCGLVGNPDAEADVVTGVVVNPEGGGD
ncbi:MAG TPA: hypothetical protein VHS09_10980 [Polyangiaceae bacterium]|nr:hypothetical protein [Polyangiaceae bacterium]